MFINDKSTFFAPQLFINNGVKDISFYTKAFEAIEHFCFTNTDGSVHVAELSIDDAIFHLHEITENSTFFSPEKHHGTTILIGLFVKDVDSTVNSAIDAGALEITAAKDYEYGYRQAEIKDPFGHHWMIQSKIEVK
jgi:PhnB protein